MPSIRNIIIFVSIALAMVISYVVFIKGGAEPADNLVSVPAATLPDAVSGGSASAPIEDPVQAEDFLNLLLSVKNIKLDDSIFREVAWSNLVDSSIELVPSGDEGRPNPFAPLGVDVLPPEPQSASFISEPVLEELEASQEEIADPVVDAAGGGALEQ